MNMIFLINILSVFGVFGFHLFRVVNCAKSFEKNSQTYSFVAFCKDNFLPALFVSALLLNVFGAISTTAFEITVPFRTLGLFVGYLGIGFCLWARITQSANWKLYSELPDEDHLLCTTGPYTWSRHPYYFGLIVHCAGFVLASANIFVAVVATLWIVGAILVALKEEQDLERHFGWEWNKYKKKTHFLFGKN